MSRLLVYVTFIVAGGLLTGLVAGGLITGWDDFEGVARSVAIGLLYTAVMTGICVFAGRATRRYIPLNSPWAVVHHVLAQTTAIAGSFAVATILSLWLFRPYFSMEPTTLGIVGLVAIAAALLGNTIVYTLLFFRRARKAERAALQSELSALRAQINPHFLFNTLNTIAALTRSRPAVAETVTEDLADLFRYSLRASQQHVVTLREELESARLYLIIEKARFGDRLEMRFDAPENVLDIELPSLILQPLVENAVKHGVCQVLRTCEIAISVTVDKSSLFIKVTDSGPGFGQKSIEDALEQGTGLANVRKRLRAYDPQGADLELLPQGVLIRLPRSVPRNEGALQPGSYTEGDV